MHKQLVLILGGIRSGKSAFALSLASRLGERVLFLATATPGDEEMARRIALHQKARPPTWRTIEEPLYLAAALRREAKDAQAVVLDCLTLWLSNWLSAHAPLSHEAQEASALAEVAALLDAYRDGAADLICLSNEVGLGVIPPTPLGRRFQDLRGRINQQVATAAVRVVLMVAGIPADLKAPSPP